MNSEFLVSRKLESTKLRGSQKSREIRFCKGNFSQLSSLRGAIKKNNASTQENGISRSFSNKKEIGLNTNNSQGCQTIQHHEEENKRLLSATKKSINKDLEEFIEDKNTENYGQTRRTHYNFRPRPLKRTTMHRIVHPNVSTQKISYGLDDPRLPPRDKKKVKKVNTQILPQFQATSANFLPHSKPFLKKPKASLSTSLSNFNKPVARTKSRTKKHSQDKFCTIDLNLSPVRRFNEQIFDHQKITRNQVQSIRKAKVGNKLKPKQRDMSTKVLINKNKPNALSTSNYTVKFYRKLNVGTRFDKKSSISRRSLSVL
ncbi:unnamed protein product [Moneuplotes crassus]|uniref:Uncharacterized protein n=1 Tax=Euplotes crassus TaxID=5936 RepID=A0AAD1UHC7_EUPCR|nr:unnamed protein product [Moneuplotes crassus]